MLKSPTHTYNVCSWLIEFISHFIEKDFDNQDTGEN